MALARGTRLGPYQIDVPIGAGGMGEVYKATDTRLERTIAIKVLPGNPGHGLRPEAPRWTSALTLGDRGTTS